MADDEALSQSSILNSTIYSSAPDFELLSKTTRIGLLKDGDMLVVVAGAGGRGEIASDPLISDDVELPVSSATAGTRSLADAFKKMDGGN